MKVKARKAITLENGTVVQRGALGEVLSMRQGSDGKVRGFEAIFYGFPHVIAVHDVDVENL